MALKLIKNDRVIEGLKPGGKRLTDGGGLYLLPAAKEGGQHGWRFDYTFEGKRKTISLGTFPAVSLALARDRAVSLRLACLTATGIARSPTGEASRSSGQWAQSGRPAQVRLAG